MATILEINGAEVKIGGDDGKVVTAPIASVNYASPKVGDRVKVYNDGNNYIVAKDGTTANDFMTSNGEGKQINKHLFVWVFSFLLGSLGVDRFIRGQIGVGICKLLFNWLTFGIWELVDWIIALTKAYGSGNSSEMLTFDKDGKYVS